MPQIEQTQVESPSKLKWITNVPFRMVPFSIVSQFKGHKFSVSEFYESDIWRFPEHWNAGLFYEDRMIVFIYGNYDPLERDLYMKRLAADPDFQMGVRNNLIQMVLDEVERRFTFPSSSNRNIVLTF